MGFSEKSHAQPLTEHYLSLEKHELPSIDPNTKRVKLHQTRYTRDLVRKWGLVDGDRTATLSAVAAALLRRLVIVIGVA